MIKNNMTNIEKRTIMALASIMSMRMLGLFMILPILAIYAEELPEVTPILAGLAIGIYGLTQATFQIPFGMLSDRFGRKPVITLGLIIFALGSILAALSTSIIGIIVGRALQGVGAIASATLALAADLTREEHRTKAMALVGMGIGMSFVLALVLGPLLNQGVGVQGIFWISALLALGAITLLHTIVPQPFNCCSKKNTLPFLTQVKKVLSHRELLKLNFGILVLHFLLISIFVVVPIALKEQVAIASHWQIYLPILVASIIAMVPLIVYAEKRQQLKMVLVSAISVLALAMLGLSYLHSHLTGIVLMLFLFFTAFNLLEASLPSLISKVAPPENKGMAMGIYSSAQFLGAFLGGVGGGLLHYHYGLGAVFAFSTILALSWFIIAITMNNPRHLSSHLLHIEHLDPQEIKQLTQCLNRVSGVAEVIVLIEEGVAYLKVDNKVLDTNALNECPTMNALLMKS